MQSMEKGFHLKFLEYASEKTRWVFWWVFSSGYEVKKPGGFFRVGWVFSNVGWNSDTHSLTLTNATVITDTWVTWLLPVCFAAKSWSWDWLAQSECLEWAASWTNHWCLDWRATDRCRRLAWPGCRPRAAEGYHPTLAHHGFCACVSSTIPAAASWIDSRWWNTGSACCLEQQITATRDRLTLLVLYCCFQILS